MGHKFFRKQTKSWEEVEPVLWEWNAIYTDNTSLLQYDNKGIFHQIAEIDQSKLSIFAMENIATHQVISLEFPKGAKLFFEYENAIIKAGTPEEKRFRAYVFGYEKNFVIITFNNNVIFTDDYKKVFSSL